MVLVRIILTLQALYLASLVIVAGDSTPHINEPILLVAGTVCAIAAVSLSIGLTGRRRWVLLTAKGFEMLWALVMSIELVVTSASTGGVALPLLGSYAVGLTLALIALRLLGRQSRRSTMCGRSPTSVET